MNLVNLFSLFGGYGILPSPAQSYGMPPMLQPGFPGLMGSLDYSGLGYGGLANPFLGSTSYTFPSQSASSY